MKAFFLFLVPIILLFSLVACNNTSIHDVNDRVSDECTVSADWIMYDTLASINNSADCTIIAKVLSKNDSLSVGYDASDFSGFSSLIERDSALASKMKLSIRTPYTIKVEEVVSSNVSLSVGDTIDLYQIGGSVGGVTLNDSATVPLDVNSEYVLILKQRITSDGTRYYSMITPIQGYAKILDTSTMMNNKATTGKNNHYLTHELNHLFDSITSTADIYAALKDD